MKIELTIIIPVYNVEKYIEKCIQSVINQTYDGGIECIIVNDCSPDASMEIVERILNGYNGHIRFTIKHRQKMADYLRHVMKESIWPMEFIYIS